MGDEQFLQGEQLEVTRIECKRRTIISVGTRTQFNGVTISRSNIDTCDMSQSEKLSIEKVSGEEERVSIRAKLNVRCKLYKTECIITGANAGILRI